MFIISVLSTSAVECVERYFCIQMFLRHKQVIGWINIGGLLTVPCCFVYQAFPDHPVTSLLQCTPYPGSWVKSPTPSHLRGKWDCTVSLTLQMKSFRFCRSSSLKNLEVSVVLLPS